MRPHVSLDVRNVSASVEFYEKVFGIKPQKQTHDYAKFDLIEPALNLSLVSSTGRTSSVNHFGIEVGSIEEIAIWKDQLQQFDQPGVCVPPIMLVLSSQAGGFRAWVADPRDCYADGPCCSAFSNGPS